MVVVLKTSITCICTSQCSHSIAHQLAFLLGRAYPCVVVERSVIKIQMMSNYENKGRYLVFTVLDLKYVHVSWALSDEIMELSSCRKVTWTRLINLKCQVSL